MSKKQSKAIDPVQELRAVMDQYVDPTREEIIEARGQDYRKLLPRARSRTFTAKPCTACTALRAHNPEVKPEDNFTRVIATRGNVRYCRCYYCGNTWKDSDAVPYNGS